MTTKTANVDPAEVKKFDDLASRWWDPEGEFKPLHQLNPVRVDYVAARTELGGRRALDVGCGGGILSEALATNGAEVTGIDMATSPLKVARLHQKKSGITNIRYLKSSAEALVKKQRAAFDVVTCMEVIEHVPDPVSLMRACGELARPGGDVFFSTINRNLKAFLMAIVGAEYLLRMLPKGTHEYERFIKPSEMRRWGGDVGLQYRGVAGIEYSPLGGSFKLGNNVDVNYLMHFSTPE